MILITSFLAGLIFSLGLAISGMINPNKVIGFLDIFRTWDYSLAFVMMGAIGVNLVTFKYIAKRPTPLFSDLFHLPTKDTIDFKLVFGASIFGIGWGLMGICPGPALVNIATLDSSYLYFVVAMLAGMLIFKLITKLFPKTFN